MVASAARGEIWCWNLSNGLTAYGNQRGNMLGRLEARILEWRRVQPSNLTMEAGSMQLPRNLGLMGKI